ncbi:caspase-like [Drosophila innubila]|uniref:caspase-like n=1 Tax=Drosophila innubila TaxID=198719 RepID=UPI00148D1C7B|nr:caspase-like [Drosophila innubila]
MIAKKDECTYKKVIQNADDSTDAGLESPASSSSSTSNIRGAVPKQAFKNYNSPVPGRNAAEYNMNHKNRGMAIIFNHKYFDAEMKQEPRRGTDVDSANLDRVLKQHHFDVIQHNDFCYNQIVRVIKRAAFENHDNNDCILIAILSHGNMGYICASDTKYKLADICNLLTPNNCPTLAGKPKLFFVQACQGKQMDDGCKIQTDGDSQMGYKIPLHADFLIAYSTIPGFLSWRNPLNGSWFIQSLCLELETNGKRLDLMTLLTFVCRRVAFDFESHTNDPRKDQKKQIPCITTMLTRIVLFSEKPKSNSKLF